MNVQHTSRSDSWRTPPHIISLVQATLGGIGLDPASNALANKAIGADRFLTARDDALVAPWRCEGTSVYLNPPGGKRGNQSSVRLFWRRLMEHREDFSHAIFAMFSIEGLQTTQGDHPAAMDFPFCVPRRRVRWVDPTSKERSSPSHSNAFIYVPGRLDRTEAFLSNFSELGKVKR